MPRAKTPAQFVDELWKLRKKLEDLNAKKKELEHQFRELKEQTMVAIEHTGSDMCRTDLARATLTEKQVANVEDWDAFEEWLYDNRALYMMYRRVNVAPIREYIETAGHQEPPPGVKLVKLPELSLTKR